MSNCIKCGGVVKKYKHHGVIFDICEGCYSVIISKDNFEKLAHMIDERCHVVDLFGLKSVKAKEDERICHNCNHKMSKIFYDGVLLDRCDNCNLLFFDNGELSKYFAKFSAKNIDIMNNALFIKTFCNDAELISGQNTEPQFKQDTTNDKDIKPIISTEYKKEDFRMKINNKETEFLVSEHDGLSIAVLLLALAIAGVIIFVAGKTDMFCIVTGAFLIFLVIFLTRGFNIIGPQEAVVFTLFGKYYGTLRSPGFYWINPFATALFGYYKKISLKARTLDNGRQKINDALGNPIEVGIMVTWEIIDTAKAVFNVDDYSRFLSAQCDSALRNIVRLYPYDTPDDSGKQSLRGDSAEISEKLKKEIQDHVTVAGLNIIEAKITHLAYSSEIAIAMLQRQQANAVLDAKRAIVDGAVGMVEAAIDKLSQNKNITLDEKTKASMVNNLMVVLCSSKESQPVIRNDII